MITSSGQPPGANALGAIWFFVAFAVLLGIRAWRRRR